MLRTYTSWMQSTGWRILLFLLLMIAISVPRVWELNAFVTTDERAWVTRSGNFYRALVNGDFADTYQTEHPGVTIMWLGTGSFLWHYPAYAQEAPAKFGWIVEEIEPFLREQGHVPLDVLAVGRFFVVLAVTIVLMGSFLYAARLLGFWVAVFGFLLIAFDPFHIAHSRVLHMDAMLSNLMFLSVLAFLSYLAERRRRDLLISGVVAGLAWLTKSPTLFLGPFVALLVLFYLLFYLGQRWRATGQLKRNEIWPLIGALVVWTVIGLAIVGLFWPTMWVDPVGTVEKVVGGALFHAAEGHEHPIYFNGTVFRGDPGFGFYATTYLWRTTPMVLVGLLLAAIALVRGKLSKQQRYVAGALLLFALLYMLVMSRGAKKFDRYLLPVYAPLDLIAAMGWVAVTRRSNDFSRSLARRGAPLLLGLVLLAQVALIVPTFPHYLTYYNPLLGGPGKAPEVMMIGWGEGFELAADYINQQPNAEQMQVMAWYWDGPFSYFFKGQSLRMEQFYSHIERWLESDYVILYVNQWQRELPSPEILAYFNSQAPEHVIDINGMEYARIYNMHTMPPFDPLLAGRPLERYSCGDDAVEMSDVNGTRAASMIDWNGAIRLLRAELPNEPIEPGEAFVATFDLQAVAPITRNINVLVRVVAPDGQEVLREEGWPWGVPTSDWAACDIRPDGHQLSIPVGAPTGYYRLELGFYDNETLFPLSAQHAENEQLLGETVVIDYLPVGTLPTPENSQPIAALGEQINLLPVELNGASEAQSAQNAISLGQTLQMRLFWQAQAAMATNYTVFVHLIGPDGQMVLQRDQQPQHGFYPTAFWGVGDIIADDYELPIPPDAPVGSYELRVGMYDLTTGQRLPVTRDGQTAGDFVLLTTLTIEN